jgi:hypothetical protein
MKPPIPKLDREFLSFCYREKINEIEPIFTAFLSEMPRMIIEINDLIQQNLPAEASERIRQTVPSFSAVGLPILGVKLETVDVYLDFLKLSNAKILMKEFALELKKYLPVIINELSRLKAYNKHVIIYSARMLST